MANVDPSRLKHWISAGKLVNEFNAHVLNDARVDVLILPIFDGVSEIRWKRDY